MKILLLGIGKTESRTLQDGVADYSTRVANYHNFETRFLATLKNAASLSHEEIKSREAKLILAEVAEGDHVVLLDEQGVERASVQFAKFLQGEMNAGRKRLVFVIGGAFGSSDELKKRANTTLSLSKMTLTHDMVRLVFVEQLYRAFTILAGEKYHH